MHTIKALACGSLNIFQNIVEEHHRIQGNTQRLSNGLKYLWLGLAVAQLMGSEYTLKGLHDRREHPSPCGMVGEIRIGKRATGKLCSGLVQHGYRFSYLTFEDCIPALSDSGVVVL